MTEHVKASTRDIWPQVRRLLIFQLKLYVDALRDLLFSPLSVIALVLDLISRSPEENSLFQKLLKFGRRTEHTINLFNQYDGETVTSPDIDTLVSRAEVNLRREFEQKKRR